MTPQSNFMVAAPIAPEREDALRALLATMNLSAGVVDPNNALVPFARFERLHVARFVILHDQTLDDLAQYGETFPDAPVWLVFLGVNIAIWQAWGDRAYATLSNISTQEPGVRQYAAGFDVLSSATLTFAAPRLVTLQASGRSAAAHVHGHQLTPAARHPDQRAPIASRYLSINGRCGPLYAVAERRTLARSMLDRI